LVEAELDGNLALEDVDEHLELLLVGVDVDDLAVEVGERAGGYLHRLAERELDGRARPCVGAREPVCVNARLYCSSNGAVACGTGIKALRSLPEVPRRLNEIRVADFLLGRLDDLSSTFYCDIFRLPAGHSMVVDAEGIRPRQYWSPDPSRHVLLGSDEEYTERFRDLFVEAVRCRLRSAFAVSSTLSGGLDSSSIACTAAQILAKQGNGPLHTLSAVFPSLPEPDLSIIDERQYMEAVLALGGFEPHQVRGDCLSPLADITRVLWYTDEPFAAPNLYLHWALYGVAHQQGARVFLDGIDGDTTVSHGLGYLSELAYSFRWGQLLREAGALSTTSHRWYTPRRIVWEYAVRPLIPEGIQRVWHRARNRSEPDWSTGALVNPTFARRIALSDRVHTSSRPARTEREQHWRGLTSPLIPYTLELADKTAGAFNLDPRYPFFDRRLMEFCLGLPPHQKLHDGWTRYVMRRAMETVIPPEVQWRKRKAGLSPNITRRLVEHERGTLERVVLQDSGAIEEYVDMATLRATYDRYVSPPTRTAADAVILHAAVVLSLWLESAGLTA